MAKLILSPAPYTVRKIVGRSGWLIEGEVAIVAGKVANQPFSMILPTKAKAEAEAARRDRINAEAVAELEAETIAEVARIAERKAAKVVKAAKAARQFAFDF